MGFGAKYTFNPVPNTIGMLLVAEAEMGKSTLLSQWVKDGKMGVIVDADGRFDEVITETSNFVPLSNKQYEMIDAKTIHDMLHKNMPNDDVGLIAIDSVTAIFEPIILGIQRQMEEKKNYSARNYKEKADAMKFLVAGVTPWGCDHVWVYHYRERSDVNGNVETTTTITDLELSRLWRNINLKTEIIKDGNGKRGLRILSARGGRSGFVIWDESGNWKNIRQRVETEVWGGLSKDDQQQLIDDAVLFSGVDEAIRWGMDSGVFKDEQHALNSYNGMKESLLKEHGTLTPHLVYGTWRKKVLVKAESQ